MRRQMGKQLNRGEHRQGVARHVFLADQGDFRSGDLAQIRGLKSNGTKSYFNLINTVKGHASRPIIIIIPSFAFPHISMVSD